MSNFITPLLFPMITTGVAKHYDFGIPMQALAYGVGLTYAFKPGKKSEIKTSTILQSLTGFSIFAAVSMHCILNTPFAPAVSSFISSQITNPDVLNVVCHKFTQGAATALLTSVVGIGLVRALDLH